MAWFNPSWLYRIPVTVDNTANATSALASFQVTVVLSGAAYTSFHAHAKSDGSDIRVTDSDGVTLLSHALEGIDTVNSAVYLLVKVPRVAAAVTSTIYIYYGNAAATSVSSYPGTVGAITALIGPNDITITGGSGYTFTDSCGGLLCLKNQGGAGGGGVGLNGRILGFGSNGTTGNGVGCPNLVKYTSSDGGVTFTSGILIAQDGGVHASVPRGAVELADGTILLCYTMDLQNNWVNGKAFQYVGRSHDGGVTWSNVSSSATNPMSVPWTYHASDTGAAFGALVEKSPGGDIYCPNYARISGDTGGHSWLSKCPAGSDPTVGSNWSVQGIIAFDNVNNFDETTVVQTSDSSHYLAIMRCETTGDLHTCTSADSGATWTTAVRMQLPGIVIGPTGTAVSPSLLKLQSGNYLLNWGVRYGSVWGTFCMLSTDGGVTWLDRAPAVLQATPPAGQVPGNYGYSTQVQRADGVIVANLFHQVAGPSVNVAIVIYTEDWVVNSPNVYEPCESLAGFFNVGTNATSDTTHVHTGTKALKIDNSAATGGINDYAYKNLWSTNTALQTQKIAYSYWSYETQNSAGRLAAIKDSTGGGGALGNRISTYVIGATFHQSWYDGAAQHDTGVVVPENQWNKIGIRAAVLAASATGELRLNGVSTTTALGQSGSGGAPQMVLFQGGSTAGTTNVIYWLDDIYTHQYAANIPAVTAGSEQANTTLTADRLLLEDGISLLLLESGSHLLLESSSLVAGPTTATLSGPATGSMGIPSTNFTITLDQPAATGGVVCSVTSSAGGDTVTPSTVTITAGATTGTFTVTPFNIGVRSISVVSTSPTLTIAGSPIAYTSAIVAPTTATLSGPATANNGSRSDPYTITLDRPATAAVTCTITDSVGGDTITSTPVVIAIGSTTGSFRITPSSTGARTISLVSTSPVLTRTGTPITLTSSNPPPPPTFSGSPIVVLNPAALWRPGGWR